jgi:hypothetical protein
MAVFLYLLIDIFNEGGGCWVPGSDSLCATVSYMCEVYTVVLECEEQIPKEHKVYCSSILFQSSSSYIFLIHFCDFCLDIRLNPRPLRRVEAGLSNVKNVWRNV